MKIFIIIFSVVLAAMGGYIFRMAINEFIEDKIIIANKHPLKSIPDTIKYTIFIALFLFFMSVILLIICLKGPS